jgi:tripartite-type tricarboxylate transporter receptor subunit TctC
MIGHAWGTRLLRGIVAIETIFMANGAHAQDVDQFFKTHSLTLGASATPGSSYDAYMRLLSRHIGRHIPGAPSVVVQNVPSGGGMALANQIFNSAPKDGSYIGVLHGSTLLEEIYKSDQVKFEAVRYAWVGNMLSEVDTCVTTKASGVKSADDLFSREVAIGATGAGAQSYSFPVLYNQILGTKLKIVNGYPGTPERVVAMERGELEGACGITTTSFRSTLERQARDGSVIMIAQAGSKKDHRYPDVPNMLDFAKTPADKQALQFVFAPLDLGRPIAAPPGIPPERLAQLRRAFDETMQDSEFLADAEKLKMDVEPMRGAATADAVRRLFATPASAIDRVTNALAQKAN